jgi:hypothetical protein
VRHQQTISLHQLMYFQAGWLFGCGHDDFSGKASTAVKRGEFDDEVDDELSNAISQFSSSSLSCQNNGAFPCAIVAKIP